MYALYTEEKFIGFCKEPRYVKRVNSIWQRATLEEAEAISVKGDLYNLQGKNIIDSPELVFLELDNLDIIYNTQSNIDFNDDVTIKIEDIINSLNILSEEQLANLENFFCDLDTRKLIIIKGKKEVEKNIETSPKETIEKQSSEIEEEIKPYMNNFWTNRLITKTKEINQVPETRLKEIKDILRNKVIEGILSQEEYIKITGDEIE